MRIDLIKRAAVAILKGETVGGDLQRMIPCVHDDPGALVGHEPKAIMKGMKNHVSCLLKGLSVSMATNIVCSEISKDDFDIIGHILEDRTKRFETYIEEVRSAMDSISKGEPVDIMDNGSTVHVSRR